MKKIRIVSVLLLLLFFCGGCSTNDAADGKIILKLSSALPTDDRSHTYLLKACDEILEKTDGMLEIQFCPNSELGGLKDNMEQIVRGASIIAFADPGYISEFVPDIGVLTGPYLYNDYSDIKKIIASDWYADLCQTASEKNIKIFAFNWYLGSRYYIADRPLTTPEDFSNVKARSQSFSIAIETTKALGATPITMAFSEVYAGLSQGVIDAAESPLSGIYNAKWQEAVTHLSLTQHFIQIVPLTMSQEVFDSLTPEYQDILVETFEKYSEESNAAIAASEDEWLQKFIDDGIEVHEVDREALKNACQDVYSDVTDWTPGTYETVCEIING